MNQLGNDLYTGEKSITSSVAQAVVHIAVVLCLAALGPFVRSGCQLAIEFTGGSKFTRCTSRVIDRPADRDRRGRADAPDSIPRDL